MGAMQENSSLKTVRLEGSPEGYARELDYFERDIKGIIEESLGVIISYRGDDILIRGEEGSVNTAKKILKDISDFRKSGNILRPADIISALDTIKENGLEDLLSGNIPIASRKRNIIPRTHTQRLYIQAIRENDIVVGIGPAGTGKTYLAMAMAVHAYQHKLVSRIILSRPAVEAGERLGFLPGDIQEKVNPYLRPLYDALYDMVDATKAFELMEKGIIEMAPLAFMRGRTLNDSFIILDEAQNTTSEQMKMFLTRLGNGSKAVITGDVTQIDIEQRSGLIEIKDILHSINGIRFIYFNEKDVVRHKLVQEIIKAYERIEKGKDKREDI